MSTTIDQRVVEMRFDNRQFESNVSTTMSTIDKLKQSLQFKGATKGLENINSAAKQVNMSPITSAVETVGLKFNAMYTIADQALRNITNSAMNYGKRIVSALTIDPIKTGFSEYETQINAVQTILANTESKGTKLSDVNSALDELNTYADKTIYNFTEMTRNIGTFTAAGIDLDTSVSAIQGIANLAAVSGSNSQQASTAMYQLSQALASGTVKLMDWNSVVNAGMGGQVFQDALKQTARVHGVAVDDMIKKHGSFRESLTEGWITADILTETLENFTMSAKEGSKEWDDYKQSLRDKGYTEEQAESILKMANTATDAATKVKTFTQLWDTLKESAQSGWTQTWEILVGDFEEAKELLTQVSDTIGAFIGATADARNEMLENWKVMGGRTVLIEALKNAFKGVISIVKPIKDAFREIFPPITSKQLLGFTEGLKNLTAKFTLSDKASENLKRTFKGLFAVVDIVKQVFVAIFKAVGSLTGEAGALGGGILSLTAKFGDWLVALSEFIRSSGILNKVFGGIADIIKAAFKGASSFVKFIKNKFAVPGWELLQTILDRVKTGMSGVGEVAGGMKDTVVSVFDAMGIAFEKSSFVKVLQGVWKVITTIGAGIAKVFGGVVKGLTNVFGNLDFNGILGVVNSLVTGGLLASLIKFFEKFSSPLEDMKDLAEGILGKVTGIFDGVRDCLKGYQDQLKAETLKKIAIAIGILAAALLVLSFIKTEKLATSMAAITGLFTELIAAMAIFSKIDGGKGLVKMATAMIAMSTAILILSIAMKVISSLSLADIGKSLLAIAVGLGILVGAVNLLPSKKVSSAASAIKKMSTALLILSIAMKIMATMSWSELAVGLVATVVSLGALTAAANLLPKDMALRSLGIVSLATALLILSGALKIMGTMSWSELAVGLTALAGSMAVLVVSMNLMKKALPGAAAMLIVAPALLILAASLKILGTMSWSELVVGLVALAGSMTILAIALNLMKSTIPGAAALLVASAALAVLTPVLLALGAMSWESIAKGLITIAGAFAIIGVAGLVLAPIIPAILALGVAMALVGVGVLAAGVGLMAFGAGLTALSVGATALVASLGTIATGIIGIITAIAVGIGNGIIAFCEVIKTAGPSLCEAATVVIVSLCDALIAATPSIVNAIDVVLTALLKFLVDFIPRLVDAGMDLIVGILEGIASRIDDVVSAAADVIIAFIKGIASQMSRIIQAGVDTMIDFINGLANGIRSNTPRMIAAVNNLMDAIIYAIKAWFKNIFTQGKNIVGELVDGVKGMFSNFKQVGKDLMSGFSEGIKEKAQSVIKSAKDIAKKAWEGVKDFLGIKSPSRKFIEIGKYTDEGLAVGLKRYAKVATKAAVGVGKATSNSLSDALSTTASILTGDMNVQPTIRPVLDLSDVRAGAGTIGSLFDSKASVGVLANVGAVSSMMSRRNKNGNGDVVAAINKLNDKLDNAGNTYNSIGNITYDDGSNIADAVQTLVRAAKVERRV